MYFSAQALLEQLLFYSGIASACVYIIRLTFVVLV